MLWITVRTIGTRWEAELMEQLLTAHEIPVRIIAQGRAAHFGCDTPLALQVRAQDQWDALLLLSPIEENFYKETYKKDEI